MVKRHYINIACTTVQEIFPLKKKKKKKKKLYKEFKNLPLSEIKTARSRPWYTVF